MKRFILFLAIFVLACTPAIFAQSKDNEKLLNLNDAEWIKTISEKSHWKVTEMNITEDYDLQEISKEDVDEIIAKKNAAIIASCKEFIADWKTWKNRTKYSIYFVSFNDGYKVFEIKPGKSIPEDLERDLVFGKNFIFFSQNPDKNMEPGKNYILEKN